MGNQVYNSAILKMKLANRTSPVAPRVRATLCVIFLFLFFSCALSSSAANWNDPEQQLAQKVVAITGPGAVALTIENRSSLAKRESEVVGNGLRAALESLGIRFVPAGQAAASVAICLSQNQTSYVWVADIHQGANESAIVMVSIPRAQSSVIPGDSAPLVLRKITLWKQPERILDVAVLEEDATPTHIAVLDGRQVALYRWQGGKWSLEQSLAIAHARPWPRDLRGRLIPAKDHLLDVYLPGILCHTMIGAPLALNCRESDDPWPLVGRPLSLGTGVRVDLSFGPNGGTLSIASPLNAFFTPTRNFFTGVLSPHIGKFSTVLKFYSMAFVPRDKYVLWIFASIDGQVHMIDGVSDLTIKPGLDKTVRGSDIASVRTSCGAGWQVLAVSSRDENNDFIGAYEFPDRDPVAVSAALDFPGEVTALWTEAKGDSAIAVVRHRETGEYEAFRLAVVCSQ